MIPAVPEYLGKDFDTAPPGHRFSLYFPVWNNPDSWEIEKTKKAPALEKTLSVPPESCHQIDALRERQQSLLLLLDENSRFMLEAISTAPLVTGMGMEHPLENGFAFFNPYGIPYLPGSSIKGVLRRAAEELALGLDGVQKGWNILTIWRLFGFDASSTYLRLDNELSNALDRVSNKLDQDDFRTFINEFLKDSNEKDTLLREPTSLISKLRKSKILRECVQQRGVLNFHDSIPEINGNSLVMDVMTPHYGKYYQGDESPHDAGQPNPIVFMVIPAKSRFSFHVTADPNRMRNVNDWKGIMQVAFEHAFHWLGFGAKTALGYGAMEQLSEDEIKKAKRETEAANLKCDWVDETMRKLAKQNNIPENRLGDVLRGKALAEAWAALSDIDLKKRALDDIRSRWQKEGWWDSPPGRAARQSKSIYDKTG